MKAAIIKYNAGNIRSVSFALERLGIAPVITGDLEEIMSADRVIFPGVGEASTTMSYLKEHKLDQVIARLKQPVLGVCLGMQLLCRHSEENDTTCLGVFPQQVRRFAPRQKEKVPHMGWNKLEETSDWCEDFQDKYVYFVHSFYVPVCEYTTAASNYVQPFSAMMRKDNFFAAQFHPEKSGEDGALILTKFLNTIW
ncbi:MAG: imidazole glycerol phosphate synthase subunit HisH [Candidatus Nephrothrix sp. EaCA]|nr:MAG: imidazole glycerol phosphate synthase subunit HisH [Candidatus Nephrothrix sp. EaCA]